MTKAQFHGLAGVLWLIARDLERDPWLATACAAIFAYHGVAGAWAKYREVRHG